VTFDSEKGNDMNQTINDGVHAVRAAGQKVLDRVESAADEVRTEAREAGGRLTSHSGRRFGKRSGKRFSIGFGKRDRKRDHHRGRTAGLVASATSVIAFLVTLVARRRHNHHDES